MDVPFLDLQDRPGLELEASRAADLGFTGKARSRLIVVSLSPIKSVR